MINVGLYTNFTIECLCYFTKERCIVTPTPSYLYPDPYFFTLNRTTQTIRNRGIPTPKFSVLYFLPLTEPLSQSESGVSQLRNFLCRFFTLNRTTQPIRVRSIPTPKLSELYFFPSTEPLSQSETGVFQLPNFLCCIFFP